MLNRIVDAALRYRLLVLVALALIVGLGARAWHLVPVDAFPDVTPIQVSVITESPGLSPEDVERLITFPVESSLAGLPGVRVVRSLSLFGLSSVTVYFEDSVDIYFARRLVGERLQQARERLPAGFGEPELGPNATGLGQVFWYTVESADGKLSNMDLRTLQDWTIRVQLRTVPGVDEVISWGGEEKQYQVLIDPNKLIKYGLSFKSVMEALAGNNQQVGGQYLNVGREQYLVRGVGLIGGTADLAEIPLASVDGTPVYLRDVAEIREGGGLRFGAVTRDGREVVFGMALQRIGENAKNVVAGVKEKLALVQQALPEGVKLHTIYDRTSLVDHTVSTATRTLLEGGILVAVMLFLFLGEIRSALVVVASLPLAMLIAFMLMREVGLSANLMSLAGLAVAIGMMIDGAVVLVENSYRLLGRSDRSNESRVQAIRRAAFEVARPIAFAILIIIVVFLPLFSLSEIEGKLFKPMALSITFAMAGSLALTLTVIPVMASLVLRAKPERDTFLVAWAKRLYEPALMATLNHKRLFLGAAVALLALALGVIPFFGREFLPTLQEGAFLFRMSTIPSTSLEESIAASKGAQDVVRKFPQTRTAVAHIGRAERGEPEDVNRIEMLVDLKDRAEWPESVSYQQLAHEMQEALEKALPSVVIAVGQPIQHHVDELISGVRAPLALRIYGEDLAVLDRLSAEIKDVLEDVQGAADLSIEANRGKPQITVTVNRGAAARYGLSAEEILEVVRAGVGGKAVGTVLDGARRFDIQVWLKPEFHSSIEAIGNLPLRTKDGGLLPLSRVADIRVTEGYSFIRHDSLQRNAVIQMDVRGRDVNGFVRDAGNALQRHVKLPPGYVLQWGGAFENQQRAMTRLAVIVPLTIGLIFVLLYTAFNSAALAGLVITNVPFALVGGVLALFVSGQYLSVPSVIGFIAVFGVAMLNGIVLVSFITEQVERGRSVREAVREGASLRLRPVLMTASVTILGILPMLLSQGVGAETQRPLATVMVGGLITSTALTLLLLPLMYEWLASYTAKRSTGQGREA
jgi:heavy metal efflux pump (cobalt-zinc-cadmium)